MFPLFQAGSQHLIAPEHRLRLLHRFPALSLMLYRNFYPKTASHFSEIALKVNQQSI